MNNIHKNYPHSEYTREVYQPSGEVHILTSLVTKLENGGNSQQRRETWETQRTFETLLLLLVHHNKKKERKNHIHPSKLNHPQVSSETFNQTL